MERQECQYCNGTKKWIGNEEGYAKTFKNLTCPYCLPDNVIDFRGTWRSIDNKKLFEMGDLDVFMGRLVREVKSFPCTILIMHEIFDMPNLNSEKTIIIKDSAALHLFEEGLGIGYGLAEQEKEENEDEQSLLDSEYSENE